MPDDIELPTRKWMPRYEAGETMASLLDEYETDIADLEKQLKSYKAALKRIDSGLDPASPYDIARSALAGEEDEEAL